MLFKRKRNKELSEIIGNMSVSMEEKDKEITKLTNSVVKLQLERKELKAKIKDLEAKIKELEGIKDNKEKRKVVKKQRVTKTAKKA